MTHAQYLPHGLPLVAASPPEAPGQVVPCPERHHPDARGLDEGSLVQGVEHPPDCAVAAADHDPDSGNLAEHLQPRCGASLGQVEHLPRVEQVLALAHDLGALATSGLGVDEDKERVHALWGTDLERAGTALQTGRERDLTFLLTVTLF